MPNVKLCILLPLILIVKINGNEEIHFEQNFRQIGTITTGLSFGHIHGKINFKKLKFAYKSIIHYVEERRRLTKSTEEKNFIDTLSPQLQVATRTLQDIESLFFKDSATRQKRQLFLGIAMALGVVNTGMSIYNTAQIKKLYSVLSDQREDMMDGFKHVAHALEEEDHAIHQITKNVEILKTTCQYVLERIDNEINQINSLTNIVRVITLVNNLHSELLAWGRGLDSLSNGRLHPTLINPDKLRKGLKETIEKALKFGLKPLHREVSYFYKNPVSYLATEDEEIIIFVHVPLVEADPLNLFEYLPIPKQIGNIFVTIESTKTILATDLQGHFGMELSEMDLMRCQTEDKHNGKLFICANTNLIQNKIRRTCLGSLFFGHTKEVMEKCLYFPETLQTREEFAKQISIDQIVFFAKEDITLIETCPDSIRTLPNITGLTTIKVPAGCKIVTENYTFKSPIIVDVESDFIRRTIRIPRIPYLSDHRAEEMEKHLEDLKKIKMPEKIHLAEFENWIRQREHEYIRQNVGYVISLASIAIGLIVICVLVFLFLRYKRDRVQNTS